MAAEIAPAEHRAQKIQYQCCKRYPNSVQLYTETVIFRQKPFQPPCLAVQYDDRYSVFPHHHVQPFPPARSTTRSPCQAGR